MVEGVSAESNSVGLSPKTGGNYAVVKDRTKYWQGFEQDITSRISSGATYSVSACVVVSGPLRGCTDVMATLKLEFHGSATSYLFIGKTSVSKGKWEMVRCSFSSSTVPKHVIFYLEGPPPGDQLIINSVVISCSNSSKSESYSVLFCLYGILLSTSARCSITGEEIVINPQFVDGLSNWSGRGCMVVLHDSMTDEKIFPQTGTVFATATERTQSWNGIQQKITGRVQGEVPAKWFPIKSPPPGTDILVNVLSIKHAEKIPPSPPPVIEVR
ncbi:hypothetical protein V6N12_040686 [Hibiscus sabdariffa]|uniref:CBM-cenC domain-containing protein n=1 Tax=Hibiscus sabdariffa TaxID=183260 RepID=A0ABR2E4V1_9ROSI